MLANVDRFLSFSSPILGAVQFPGQVVPFQEHFLCQCLSWRSSLVNPQHTLLSSPWAVHPISQIFKAGCDCTSRLGSIERMVVNSRLDWAPQ